MEKEFNESVVSSAKDAIQSLYENKDFSVTYFIPLLKGKSKSWYLVFAWQNGYEHDEKEAFACNDYRICGKIAFCANNSMMHDYDMDFLMPYDERGNVFDTECSISASDDIDALLRHWSDDWDQIKQPYIEPDQM